MNRQAIKFVSAIVVLIVILGIAGAGYIYVSGGAGVPSAPISAPALSVSDSSQKHFRIDPTKSQVQFSLTQELMGQPKTAIGTTNQVTGDIVLDPDHLASAQIGEIRIDARSLATDSSMRDRTIRSQILQSSQDKYEYITFTPTSLTGLPDKATAGQEIKFQIVGNLTIHDVTKPVTFDATATWVTDSPEHVEGSATATVKRTDFNLQIPNIPSVANVSDAVKLTITFQATPASDAAATAAATAAPTSAQ